MPQVTGLSELGKLLLGVNFYTSTLAFSCKVVHEKLWTYVYICKSYIKKITGTFFMWTQRFFECHMIFARLPLVQKRTVYVIHTCICHFVHCLACLFYLLYGCAKVKSILTSKPTVWVKKSRAPKTFCNIFTQVKYISMKFCQYVASLYLHIYKFWSIYLYILTKWH